MTASERAQAKQKQKLEVEKISKQYVVHGMMKILMDIRTEQQKVGTIDKVGSPMHAGMDHAYRLVYNWLNHFKQKVIENNEDSTT